ncbi:MAG: M48 family metallopeptidase [Campylobacteraceae bacterium]|nr:M48 family metallopeptidase [Campylobacteraceae bacterium]
MKKVLFATILLFFVGCATTTNPGVVGANRSQMLLVSAEKMDQGAAAAYTQVLKSASSKKALNTDPVQTKRVRGIADRLINEVGVFRADAKNWDWQVNVIREDTVNAWCMPGGRIAVYTGIINKLNLTDAELSAIVGHEMAHALREHSREKASRDYAKNAGIFAVGILTGSDAIANLANTVAEYTISLPFSREQEIEADNIGTELMARAGYNPEAAANVWVKMKRLNQKQPLEFMSTHPSHENRVENLTKIAKKVMPLYQSRVKI